MNIIKNLTKKKIIVLSSMAFLLLVVAIFLCFLRTQNIDISKRADDNSFNKIIVNADCDIYIFSGETDVVALSLTGTSKQFFKKPAYEVGLRIEDGSLIIDVNNDTAYSFKDIRYKITLTIYLPQNAPTDYDIVLNSKQGIIGVGDVDVSSIRAKDIKGRVSIVNSSINDFELDGFSGYVYVQNCSVRNFDVKNMRTGQVGIRALKSSKLNVDLLDGIIYMYNLSGYEDCLDANVSVRKGSCDIIMDYLSSLNMTINTDKAHTYVALAAVNAIDCDLSSNKGKIENNFATDNTSDFKVKINSEKGNIVLAKNT